jgi:hypothetical protein
VHLAAMDGSEIFDPHQEARCPTVNDPRRIRTEPAPNYLSNPNPSLCFHTVVAQCKETQLELPVVAQLDDGATPSLISSAIAKALRVPLRTRDRPVVITGMGGKTLCTQECTLYIRVVGESLHAGLDAVEGLYGIHFLVHPTCPFPMLIGTLSMDYHFINSQRQFRKGNL